MMKTLIPILDRNLGRCPRCMRLSFRFAAGALIVTAGCYFAAVGPTATIIAAVAAACLTALWFLHLVTFAARRVELAAPADGRMLAVAGVPSVDPARATRRHALRLFTGGLAAAALLSIVMPRNAVAQSCTQCPGYRYVCITTSCTTSGVYCCPEGHPYLNHCDCLCYDSTNFNCNSYSNCNYCA